MDGRARMLSHEEVEEKKEKEMEKEEEKKKRETTAKEIQLQKKLSKVRDFYKCIILLFSINYLLVNIVLLRTDIY